MGTLTHVNPCGELMWQAGLYSGCRPEEGSGMRVISARKMYDFIVGDHHIGARQGHFVPRGRRPGMMPDPGTQMHALCAELFPLPRSITGAGFRQSLAILRRSLPAMQVHEVPSGTQVFDWEVPREWVIRDAYVIAPDGTKIIDFAQSNLHVVGYSTPVDAVLPLD